MMHSLFESQTDQAESTIHKKSHHELFHKHQKLQGFFYNQLKKKDLTT